MSTPLLRLVVLYGGVSAEHDVSRVTAAHVLAAADPAKYSLVPIGIAKNGTWVRNDKVIASLADKTPLPDALDIAGTVASGWLTDKFDPRILLALYYGFRGVSLMLLPLLLSATVHPSMVLFVVIYGLDWVATVPPTATLCREIFGEQGTIVFGWVFASHQIGAAIAATGAGFLFVLFAAAFAIAAVAAFTLPELKGEALAR